MIEGRYDLQHEIAGHDFFTWLAVAVARGAERVVFGGLERPKETKWSRMVVLQRFESIIKPGPALAGLPYRIGDGGRILATPHMRDLVAFCAGGRRIARLGSTLPPADLARYTVTLRRQPRSESMNSDETAWRRFAEAIGAMVIPDYDDGAPPLVEKLAIYAGAEMNFGVVNGPMHLLTLTSYPVTIFKANVSAPNLAKHGVPPGTQLPWALPHQTLVWEDDSYDALMRWFEAWRGPRVPRREAVA